MAQHTTAYLATRGAARAITYTAIIGGILTIPTTLVAVLSSWL